MAANFNASSFLAGLAKATSAQVEAARVALGQFAAHVAGDSAELAPVDTGFLKASATFGEAIVSGQMMAVEVGHNANYAAAVHERLDLQHKQGQAKFLETSLRTNAPKLGPFIAAAMQAAG